MFGRIQRQKPSISFRETDRNYSRNKEIAHRLSNLNKNKLHDWYSWFILQEKSYYYHLWFAEELSPCLGHVLLLGGVPSFYEFYFIASYQSLTPHAALRSRRAFLHFILRFGLEKYAIHTAYHKLFFEFLATRVPIFRIGLLPTRFCWLDAPML